MAAGLGAALLSVEAPGAQAACHAFTVSAEPATVEEGGTVEVTVSRDGAVGTSQIDVETVDGSARGGADYAAVPRRTISFTNERSQTFPVPIHDDTEAEPAETFRLHLSNPDGCTVNPNFSVGPDATVTIAASDRSSATSTTAAPAPTTRPRPTTSASAAPPDTASDTSAPSPTSAPAVTDTTAEDATETTGLPTTTEAEDDQIALASDEESGSGLGWMIVVAAVIALGAALGGGWWWTSRRPLPPPG